MGLFLAKEYIKTENKQTHIPLVYNKVTRNLKLGERYFFPDDDYMEIFYSGDEIKFTHGNEERIVTSIQNGALFFNVIETMADSFDRRSIIYPLTHLCTQVHVQKFTEQEYQKSLNTILGRYMEYRD